MTAPTAPNQNRQIARPQQTPQNTALAPFNPHDGAIIETIRNADRALGQRVMELVLSRPASKPLSVDRALSAAMRERATGEREGRDFYTDAKMGNVDALAGLLRALSNVEYMVTDPRPLTQEETEDHEIKEGDTAKAVEFYCPLLRQRAEHMGMPYRPIIGIGIVRKANKFQSKTWSDAANKMVTLPEDKWTPIDPPVGRSWAWVAGKGAMKDGARKLANLLGKRIEDVSEEYEVYADLDLPEEARPDAAQVLAQRESLQRAAAIQAEYAEMPVEEARQRVQALSAQMRGPANFTGFDGAPDSLDGKPDIVDGELLSEGPGGTPEYDNSDVEDVAPTGEVPAEAAPAPETPAQALCPIHHVAMQAVVKHDSSTVWLHKMTDGSYCNGETVRAPKQAV